jgi:hypothetical protein
MHTTSPRRLAGALAAALVLVAAAAPGTAAAADYGDQLLQQQERAFKPVRDSKLAIGEDVTTAAAPNQPQWIPGVSQNQIGTSCIGLNQYPNQTQVNAWTSYWGTQDTSYPKIGDRYWGRITVGVIGPGCAFGIHLVATEIALPAGTQLAINPQSNDPDDKVRCYGTTSGGQFGEITNGTWVHPDDSSFNGKFCDSTQVFQGSKGIHLGQRLLAQGQTFDIVFPLRSTRKLSGIGEPGNASRLTSFLTTPGSSDISPFQWVFVGDRPVEAPCAVLGADAASAITDTTAHTKNFMCNWYRTGKAQIEIGEGTSGPYQAMSPQYDVDGQFQGYFFDQDWQGLKPGTDYHWRLRFTDTKGTATTADDQLYLGQPSTFKTTGSPPAPGTGGPPTPGGGGAGGGGGTGPGDPTPDPGGTGDQGGTGGQGQTGQQQQQEQQPEQQQIPRDTQAPGLSATAPKLKLSDLLKKGLRASATCSEGCTVQAQLQIDAKTAKKLKLGKKLVVIAKGSAAAPQGGKVTVPVKLTAKAKKALKRARSLKATLVVTATDSAGNSSKPVTRKLSLKR